MSSSGNIRSDDPLDEYHIPDEVTINLNIFRSIMKHEIVAIYITS